MPPNESQSPSNLPPLPPGYYDDYRISAALVRGLCGNISESTLDRWLARADLAFPKPIVIGRRRYWRFGDVRDWLASREVAA